MSKGTSQPATLLIVGAGVRGTGYAQYAVQFPEEARVVGVAEPRDFFRNRIIEQCGVRDEHVFIDWREAVECPRFADAVIISTQDSMHTEPALAFAEKGYHILLEKPMAPTQEECQAIVKSAIENKILLAVSHVLRYTSYTRKVKELIDSGVIGDVVSIQHLEPVTYWHQAHSYVRGNWRREDESSNMLMAKSCHDLDWIRYIMDVPCNWVSSFGNTFHFRKSAKPEGAGMRCLDCAVEAKCPYSAKRIYLDRGVMQGKTGWPVQVLTTDTTVEGVTEALRTGPYGRCVYECDNDVVDHQVVNMEFEGGRTASFVMTGFNLPKGGGRQTRIFGTHGEIMTDSISVAHTDFLTEETVRYDTDADGAMLDDGHGGGDFGLMKGFIAALRGGEGEILSGPKVTLESHLMVFAAERSRLSRKIESIPHELFM